MVQITRAEFLADRQGRTFADVASEPLYPFEAVLKFFNDEDRQRRMEESELHHDRTALAGVVREFESHEEINRFLAGLHGKRTKRFRQAVGVLVRMIMCARGWRKTGRKGSLGVRAAAADETPPHNTGGLAFWFLRAERYEPAEGMPFQSVKQRCRELDASQMTSANQPSRKEQPEKETYPKLAVTEKDSAPKG